MAINRSMPLAPRFPLFFFFNDTATTEIYTLSLHDALPILGIHVFLRGGHVALDGDRAVPLVAPQDPHPGQPRRAHSGQDRKSTRLNSSHQIISYAVFCLKKKNTCTTETSVTNFCTHLRRHS